MASGLPLQERVDTPFGAVDVVVASGPAGDLRAVPEYESCRRVAEAAGVPLRDVFVAAEAAFGLPRGQ